MMPSLLSLTNAESLYGRSNPMPSSWISSKQAVFLEVQGHGAALRVSVALDVVDGFLDDTEHGDFGKARDFRSSP